MNESSRPRRRPSSAQPGSRPRKLAGRPETSVPAASDETAQPVEPVEPAEPVAPPVEVRAEEPPGEDPEPSGPPLATRLLGSRRTTLVLVAVIFVLALASLGGGVYLLVKGDEPASAGDTAPSGDALLTISPDDARVAAATAGQAAYDIVATSWEDYDQQVDDAAALMTSGFAEEYRETAEAVRDDLVESQTEVQVTVVGQGVVRANDTEVQTLVFLNQVVTKAGEDSVYTPYRALVTLVRDGDGWLVADLETA